MTSKNRKHRAGNPELGVGEAAATLNVSERTVINFIRTRRIQALKVGKRWFMDRASLEAFRSRYRFGSEAAGPPQDDVAAPAATVVAPRRERAGQDRPDVGLHRLACYRLAIQAFSMPNFGALKPEDQLSQLKASVLEALGAGYYSYGHSKLDLYVTARAHLGAILGLLECSPEVTAAWSAEVSFLQRELLPAMGALIRRIAMRRPDRGVQGFSGRTQ